MPRHHSIGFQVGNGVSADSEKKSETGESPQQYAPLGGDLEKKRSSGLAQQPSHGQGAVRRGSRASTSRKDPFSDEEDSEVKYRTMAWWQCAMIMIAETVSLGILSLPSVLATIGMVPGVILILGLGFIATYTGYVIWQFKMRYPHVVNMADAGEVLLGAVGREVFGAAQVILLVFSAASHILTFTIAFNAITGHATCTIVWAVIALVIFFIATLPRTMKGCSYLSIAAFISITAAVMICMIGVGIEQLDPVVQATITNVSFAEAFLSVTNIVFAYIGHAGFFTFMSEMRDIKEFPRTLYVLQTFDITLYTVVGIVVYRYAGANVASPALGSTAPIVKKVSYGIALPTILTAGVIYVHVAAKYVYVRMFRGTKHMGSKSWKSYGTWVAITGTMWVIAFVIAESIPDFNDLLALISSLFGSIFTYALSGVFWFHLNHGEWLNGWKNQSLSTFNLLIIIIGLTTFGCGLYASGTSIANSSSSGSWSCADNSQNS